MASKRRFRRTLHGRTIKLQSGAEKPHDSLDELFKKNGISAFDAKFENPPKDKPVELMVPKVRSQPIRSLLPPLDQSLQCDSAVQQHRECIPDSTKIDILTELFKQDGISEIDKVLFQYTEDKAALFDDYYPMLIGNAYGAKVENPPKDKPVELMVPKVRSQPIRSLLPSFDQSLQCDSAVQQHRECIPDSTKIDILTELFKQDGISEIDKVLFQYTEDKAALFDDYYPMLIGNAFDAKVENPPKDKPVELMVKAANITQKSSQSVLTAGPHISTVQSLSRLLEKNDTSKASSNQNFVEPKQSLGKRSTPETFDASDEEDNIVPSKKSKQA